MPSSQYRGVHFYKRTGRWEVKIKCAERDPDRRFNLGMFADEEEAARVYDAVALELRGNDAVLNFDGKPPVNWCLADVHNLMRKVGLL